MDLEEGLNVLNKSGEAVQEPCPHDADSNNTAKEEQEQGSDQSTTLNEDSSCEDQFDTRSRESSPLSDAISMADPNEEQDIESTQENGSGGSSQTQKPDPKDDEDDEDNEERSIVIQPPPKVATVQHNADSALTQQQNHQHHQQERRRRGAQRRTRQQELTDQEHWKQETARAISQIPCPSTNPRYTYDFLDSCFAHALNPVFPGSQPEISLENIDPGRDGPINPFDTTRFQQPITNIKPGLTFVSQFWVRPANMPFPKPPSAISSQDCLKIYLYWCKCKRAALDIRAKPPSPRVSAVVAEFRFIDRKWQMTVDEIVNIEAEQELEDMRNQWARGRRRSARDERMGVDNLRTWFL